MVYKGPFQSTWDLSYGALRSIVRYGPGHLQYEAAVKELAKRDAQPRMKIPYQLKTQEKETPTMNNDLVRALTAFLADNLKGDQNVLAHIDDAMDVLEARAAAGETQSWELEGKYTITGNPVIFYV